LPGPESIDRSLFFLAVITMNFPGSGIQKYR
jgi:hypothetical protein